MLIPIIFSAYDIWPLGHKVGFDGATRTIYAHPATESLDIKVDVYSAWKEWASLREHTKFPFAIRGIGGDPTVQSQRAGDIYFLMNNWKLVLDLAIVRVTGTLYSENYESPYFNSLTGLMMHPVSVSSVVNTVETLTNVVTGDIGDVPVAPTALEIAAAVAAHQRTLTVQKYLGLR